MRETKALPQDLLEPLNEARQALKLSQAAIAEQAKVPQATVSNCLRGGKIQKESILAILNVLTSVLGEKGSGGAVSAEEAARFTQAIQKAYASCTAGEGAATFRAHPGGGMPPNAVNRLDRPALWRQMEETLQDHPFSMAVDGPLQCGKTTLLLQLAEAARREQFLVAWFDCLMVTEGQPSSVLFSGLARTLASEWGLDLPALPPSDSFSFNQWLLARRRAQPEPRCLLILDQLTDLEMDLIQDLESSIRVLHNQRGLLNLSFVVARSPRSVDCEDWMLKSRGYFHPHVDVGWFSPVEVQQLVALHPNCPQDGEVARILYKEFGGQPYLIHSAISRLAILASSFESLDELLHEIVQEALRLEGQFGWFSREVGRALESCKSEEMRRMMFGKMLPVGQEAQESDFSHNLAKKFLDIRSF
ncbi:MAG TPA: hypothetical protein VF789_13495 [Thermoanaerobaculia bacterium]